MSANESVVKHLRGLIAMLERDDIRLVDYSISRDAIEMPALAGDTWKTFEPSAETRVSFRYETKRS